MTDSGECDKIFIENQETGGGARMIGFSIMMWFVAVGLLIVGVSRLRGNTSSLHGKKQFEKASDKKAFAKAMSGPVFLICAGFCLCGAAALCGKSDAVILYAVLILLGAVIAALLWGVLIVKRYCSEKE